MDNPFDNKDIKSYNDKTFGIAIMERRQQLGLTLRNVAESIGVSAPFLSDVEKGRRAAPFSDATDDKRIYKLQEILKLNDSQKLTFLIMAYIGYYSKRNAICLIDKYILENPNAIVFIAKAFQQQWDDNDWQQKVEKI